MIAVDQTPLDEVSLDQLLAEHRQRSAERDCLGVRTRIAHIEDEIRRRVGQVAA